MNDLTVKRCERRQCSSQGGRYFTKFSVGGTARNEKMDPTGSKV